MLLRYKLNILFFLLLPFHLMAGGSHFEVRIDSIVSDGAEFKFVATVLGNFDYDSSGCKVISVSGGYDSTKWAKMTKLIDEKIHLEAVRILQNSKIAGTTLNFGYIGSGLNKVGECKYESKGLFGGNDYVFSIYERI